MHSTIDAKRLDNKVTMFLVPCRCDGIFESQQVHNPVHTSLQMYKSKKAPTPTRSVEVAHAEAQAVPQVGPAEERKEPEQRQRVVLGGHRDGEHEQRPRGRRGRVQAVHRQQPKEHAPKALGREEERFGRAERCHAAAKRGEGHVGEHADGGHEGQEPHRAEGRPESGQLQAERIGRSKIYIIIF